MKKLIELLETVNRMDKYKMEEFMGKLFGYIALYIILIGVFACLFAWILK